MHQALVPILLFTPHLISVEVSAGRTADSAVGSRTIRVESREELRRAVAAAAPGTKILIAPGTYQGGLTFTELHGEEGKPVVIAAADSERPPVFEGGATCMHLVDPAYVELHNLVFTQARANGLNIDDGGTFETPARHVQLKGLVVHDVGSGGNHDGIKLSGLDDFRVEDCIVERWGSKGSAIDMVGCHRGVVS